MKKNILILTLGILFAAACSQNESEKYAKIEFTGEKEHDFGQIAFDGEGIFEFKFKNTGEEPLIITNVKSSCGCTVPTYPKDPLKKGEEGSIKVKYDTKRTGSFSKTITVYSNTKDSPVQLKIKGEVLPQ